MNAPFQQTSRLGRLTTALGPDVLSLLRFEGEEHLNALFLYRVEALAAEETLDFDALIGQPASVRIATFNRGESVFHGLVTEVRMLGAGENGWRYELILRPWLYLLSLRRKQQIYHDKTAIAILEEVFAGYDGRVDNRLGRALPTLEYTVQYRESDLDFVTRQMERFGISYHFAHDDDGHVLVLTDSVASLDECPGGTRPFRRTEDGHRADEEHLWSLQPGQRMTTGAIRLTDYNFKSPTAAMEVDRAGDAAHTLGQLEGYDYPGDYLDQGAGRTVAKLRVEAERGQAQRLTGTGDCVSLRAGQIVEITGDPTRGAGKLVVLGARHLCEIAAFGTDGTDGPSYRSTHLFLPAGAPLLPERKTAVPTVQGPQTARVVGAGEIDCDEYGRILVQFHWDLDGRYSMRCRVSQNWAGKGWGGMVIPRIGMEVVVEFLEGDPDKPLVTGCVYNGRNDPPYSLPSNKTKSVFKTDTHQGSGFNELMFEDQKDEELIFMHGQKDQQIEIQNDRAKNIGRDQSETVGRDKSITVGQDHSESVGRDARHTVARDVLYDVGQNQQERYGKDHVHVVGNILKQDIFADHLTKVGRNGEHTVLGRYTLDVNQSITTNTRTHTLMAFEKFVIKGPGGKITIDASGITLEAAKIDLKGNVTMGGMGSSQVPTLQGAANAGLPLVEECLAQEEDG